MKSVKKDENGFTLVELIIAVVIMAIVMTPLLHNFAQSTRLNGKAKLAMDATNMASNVMEGLSAYEAEDIILAFESEHSVTGGSQNTLALLPVEVTCGEYGELKATNDPGETGTIHPGIKWEKGYSVGATIAGGNADYTNCKYAESISANNIMPPDMDYLQIKASADNPAKNAADSVNYKKYYFYMKDVQQVRGKYDVAVVLDASYDSGYTADTNRDGKVDSTEQEYDGGGEEIIRYNDYESAKLTSINGIFDRIYQENSNLQMNVLTTFSNMQTNQQNRGTPSSLKHVLERTMTIDIYKDAGDNIIVDGTEQYELLWSSGSNQDWWLSGGSYESYNVPDWFNNSSYNSSNRPAYTRPTTRIFDSSEYHQQPRNIYIYYYGNYSSAVGRYLDNFVINNSDDLDINIHLLRIKSPYTTVGLEATYASKISLNEDATEINTQIYSNLRDNIMMTNEQNNVATYRGNHNRCPFYLNGIEKMDNDAEYSDAVHENGGVEVEKKDRLYNVMMYVYESGAADAGFPDDMLVTTFDSSSNQ